MARTQVVTGTRDVSVDVSVDVFVEIGLRVLTHSKLADTVGQPTQRYELADRNVLAHFALEQTVSARHQHSPPTEHGSLPAKCQ